MVRSISAYSWISERLFGGNLQIGHLAAPIRIHRKKALECVHALRQAFGIIEPIDPDHHRAPGETFQHALDQRRAHRTPCQSAKFARLDTDGKDATRTTRSGV